MEIERVDDGSQEPHIVDAVDNCIADFTGNIGVVEAENVGEENGGAVGDGYEGGGSGRVSESFSSGNIIRDQAIGTLDLQ